MWTCDDREGMSRRGLGQNEDVENEILLQYLRKSHVNVKVFRTFSSFSKVISYSILTSSYIIVDYIQAMEDILQGTRGDWGVRRGFYNIRYNIFRAMAGFSLSGMVE